MMTFASSPMAHPSLWQPSCRPAYGFALLPLFGLCRNEFAADRQALAEPRLDDLAGAGAMHAGHRAARNPLARRQGDAAPRHQFEQKERPRDRQFGISAPTTSPLLLPKSETIAIGPSSLIAPKGELAISIPIWTAWIR